MLRTSWPPALSALAISAAGEHNLLLVGPPRAGKMRLARALPRILPPMSPAEEQETAAIYHELGFAAPRGRPFRALHHSTYTAGLASEAALAHNGVLFLDELPKFHWRSLEVLRRILESGRAGRFPARFLLVVSVNLHPGGEIERYQARLLGPFVDHIDLLVHVDAAGTAEALSAEPLGIVRAGVIAARQRAKERRAATGGIADVRERDARGLKRLVTRRTYRRVIRVARTIADLDGSDAVTARHIEEAMVYAAA